MTHDEAAKLTQEILNELFTNGFGEQAQRLLLSRSGAGSRIMRVLLSAPQGGTPK